VRLLLPNPKVALKPGMFTTVRIHTQPTGETLLVPIEAVIRSGERSLVFVSRGDGRFEGRDITLGVEGDEDYEVLSGLAKDDQVVTSGQFLLDSESHLREAVKKLLGGNVADPNRDAGSPGAPPMEMGMGMDMRGGADAGQAH
jgi:multidrug efflux pump subunit AcrA (membrane-fusion protein)